MNATKYFEAYSHGIRTRGSSAVGFAVHVVQQDRVLLTEALDEPDALKVRLAGTALPVVGRSDDARAANVSTATRDEGYALIHHLTNNE